MNRNKRLLTSAAAGLGIGIVALLIQRNSKASLKAPQADQSLLQTGKTQSGISLPSTGNDQFPIRFGSKGRNVQYFQQHLIEKGGIPQSLIQQSGGADGVFGRGTENAAKAAGYPVVITKEFFTKNVRLKQDIINDIPTTQSGVSPGVMANRLASHIFRSYWFSIDEMMDWFDGVTSKAQFDQIDSAFRAHPSNFDDRNIVFRLSKIAWSPTNWKRITDRLTQLGISF